MKRTIIFASVFLFLIFTATVADRGMISIVPVVRIGQPGQKAIVAWNGHEELIILSTDVRAESSTIVLEILPLPSNPTEVKSGDFESFEKLAELIR
jgi:hypothetical protein